MKWTEVMILGELFVLSLIYNYVALCRLCAVLYPLLVASICYFLINRHMFPTLLFIFVSLSIFFHISCFLAFLLLRVLILRLPCLFPISNKSTFRCHLVETQMQ